MKQDGKSRRYAERTVLVVLALSGISLTACKKSHSLTPEQEQDQFVGQLTRSGPLPDVSADAVLRKVTSLQAEVMALGLKTLAEARGDTTGITSSPPKCFRDGCTWETHYKNRAQSDLFEREIFLSSNSPLVDWPVIRAPLFREKDGLRASWALPLDKHRAEQILVSAQPSSTNPATADKVRDPLRGE